MATVSRTLYFREASFKEPGKNLKNILEGILSRTLPAQREERLTEGETWVRLISSSESIGGSIFCRMLLFDKGSSQLIVSFENNGDYSLSSISTNDIKGRSKAKREFVNSILYFAVIDNFLVIMGSQALKPASLEKYLNWLFRQFPTQEKEDLSVQLNNRVPKEAKNKALESPIKRLVFDSYVGQSNSEQFTVENKSFSEVLSGEAANAVKSVIE